MNNKMIFADDLTACPRCGSELFWQNWTSLGDDGEIISFDCINCGSRYYGRNYYQQRYGKPKAGNKKKKYTEKE